MPLRAQQNGRKPGAQRSNDMSDGVKAVTNGYVVPYAVENGNGGGASRRVKSGITSVPPLIPVALAPGSTDGSLRVPTSTVPHAARGARMDSLYTMDAAYTIAETAPPQLRHSHVGGAVYNGTATSASAIYYVVPAQAPSAPVVPTRADDLFLASSIPESRQRPQQLPPFACSTPVSTVTSPLTTTLDALPSHSARPAASLPVVGRACTPLSGQRPSTMSAAPSARVQPQHAFGADAAPPVAAGRARGALRRPSPPPQSRGQGHLRRATTPPLTISRAPTLTRSNPTAVVTAADDRYATSPSPAGVPTLLLVSSLTVAPAPPRSRTARRPARVAPVAAAATIVERSRAASVSATRRRVGRGDGADGSGRPSTSKVPPPLDDPAAASQRRAEHAGTPTETTAVPHARKRRKYETGEHPVKARGSPAGTPVEAAPSPAVTSATTAERVAGEGRAGPSPSPSHFTPVSARRPDSGSTRDRRSLSSPGSTLTCTDMTAAEQLGTAPSSNSSFSHLPVPTTSTPPVDHTIAPHTPEKLVDDHSAHHRRSQPSLSSAEAHGTPNKTATAAMTMTTGMPTPEKRSGAGKWRAAPDSPSQLADRVTPSGLTAEPPQPQSLPQRPATTRATAHKAPSAPAATLTSPHRERGTTARTGTSRGTGTSAGRGGGAGKASAIGTRVGHGPGSPTTTASNTGVPSTKTDPMKWTNLKERRRRELYAWNEFLRNQKETAVGDAV